MFNLASLNSTGASDLENQQDQLLMEHGSTHVKGAGKLQPTVGLSV
jgi:hypothetical protein